MLSANENDSLQKLRTKNNINKNKHFSFKMKTTPKTKPAKQA